MSYLKKILLLGSGELGKEFTISAKRLNCYVVAVDSYPCAPAMAVADECEVVNMLDAKSLSKIVIKHQPDYIVPEIEAIKTTQLIALEKQGFCVIPNARATYLTMNRDAIRDLAAHELELTTANYAYAQNPEALKAACAKIGYPCVVKPVMSSSGKGQSIVQSAEEITKAWQNACDNMRGDEQKVIVEAFIAFDSEITLLTVKQRNGETLFVAPIGHEQKNGDYQYSWQPANLSQKQLEQAQTTAKKVTDALGGFGLFGVEFFVTDDEVIFSELSPRPHDTGMVTLISQNLSEFDLHLRAILGLPIPNIKYYGPSASAVILAQSAAQHYEVKGLEKALAEPCVEARIFGKPTTRINRRMGITLASASTTTAAIEKAREAAAKVQIV